MKRQAKPNPQAIARTQSATGRLTETLGRCAALVLATLGVLALALAAQVRALRLGFRSLPAPDSADGCGVESEVVCSFCSSPPGHALSDRVALDPLASGS